jgi:hypothetical protein
VTTHSEQDAAEIEKLLLGRRVVNAALDGEIGRLWLDDGTVLRLEGNDGGCACSAGCYDLTVLSRVDNVITRVELHNSPDGDGLHGEGVYSIFVYADNEKINLATFTGSDGNGYYGTGYTIHVKWA